jgi:hypothetical protein
MRALFAGERGGERLLKQSAFPLDRQAEGAADVGEPQADQAVVALIGPADELRVRSALDPSRSFSALAGLAAACGLRFRIDQYLAPGRGIAEATRPLPADLRELIAQTQAAADSSVLFRRT